MKFSVLLTDLPGEHKWKMIKDRLESVGFSVKFNNQGLKVSGDTKLFEVYIAGTERTILSVGTGRLRNYSNAVIPDMELLEIMKLIDKSKGTNLETEYAEEIKLLNKLYSR